MAGLPDRRSGVRWRGCSGWIRCMSFDTRCWWRGGRSGRSPASWGLSRVTVRKYLDAGGAGADGAGAAGAAGVGRGRRAGADAAGRVGAVDGRQAAADGHAAARVAAWPRGTRVGVTVVKDAVAEWKRQRREVVRAADVSAGRSGRGRLLRGAGRRRRDRRKAWLFLMRLMYSGRDFALDLRAAGSNQLSRRARPRVRALRRRAGARRVRQSAARPSCGSWSAARAR